MSATKSGGAERGARGGNGDRAGGGDSGGRRAGRRRPRPRIGVFGIGLAAYWPQFPGLRERLEGYQGLVEGRLREEAGAEVVSAGLVDTAPAAAAAGELFRRELVDGICCYAGTYACSSQVVPAVQAAGAPVLVLNLQPAAALDYARADTGEWLANCSACCVPEISCAFSRCGIPFDVVTGMLREEEGCVEPARRAWREIREWTDAVGVAAALRRTRVGFLGHTYPGMLDLYSDFTQHHGRLGTHVEVIEMCDLADAVRQVTDAEVEAKEAETLALFDISEDSPSDPLARRPSPEALDRAYRVAAGLDRLVAAFDLGGLAYYYRGVRGNEYERLAAGMILGCSLLTARGIPASGEGDLKNCQAMKIMDLLGAGGSYTELYALDFREDFVLMGHDGPFHIDIAEGRPVLRGLSLYHGKRGEGVSVEASVRHGPVTILGLTQTRDGELELLCAEGESIPGDILRIGNTNSRVRFALGPADFINAWCRRGPTHHVALGTGHVASRIARFARIAGLRLEIVGAPDGDGAGPHG